MTYKYKTTIYTLIINKDGSMFTLSNSANHSLCLVQVFYHYTIKKGRICPIKVWLPYIHSVYKDDTLRKIHKTETLCPVAQPVTYLTAGTCLTADPGVANLIAARPHTFMEIYHEIISMAIFLPSADLRRVVVIYKPKVVNNYWINA